MEFGVQGLRFRGETSTHDFRMPEAEGLRPVLPPFSNSWIMNIIWLYIALNRTPNIDCYWVGAVPKVCDLAGSCSPHLEPLLLDASSELRSRGNIDLQEGVLCKLV